jgi:hypothetical protein
LLFELRPAVEELWEVGKEADIARLVAGRSAIVRLRDAFGEMSSGGEGDYSIGGWWLWWRPPASRR